MHVPRLTRARRVAHALCAVPTAAGLRPPQDIPFVVFQPWNNTSVLHPSVVILTVFLPP